MHTVGTPHNADTPGDPFGLLESWTIALESERKSPKTVEAYRLGPAQFATWLREHGHSDDVTSVTADQLRAWLRDVGDRTSDSTAQARYKGVRLFLAWCVGEGELESSPMDNVRAPHVREKAAEVLPPDSLKALLRDCEGSDFADLRDRALILLFADTGCRLSGIVNLREPDIDLRARTARVTLKGGRELVLPFGATVARALDRYLRAKRRQRYGERDWLWLSSTNKGRFTANGVQQMLRRRGARIGVHLHPHMFRHGFADAWLRSGGSEGDLMQLAGWQSRQMLTRYAAATRTERAREAHKRLSPMDNL